MHILKNETCIGSHFGKWNMQRVHISKNDRCIGVTYLFFEMPHELLCLISIPPNTLGTLLEVFRVWPRVVQDYKVHQHVSIRDWYLELYPCGWRFPWFIYLKMIEISKPQLRSQTKITDVASPAPRGCGNLAKPQASSSNFVWLIFNGLNINIIQIRIY